jgi:hypothetical protein
MSRTLIAALATATVTLAACTSSTTTNTNVDGGASGSNSIRASDYDQTCASSSDCVGVYEGILGCCADQNCANSAINKKSETQYRSDTSARRTRCDPEPPCAPSLCDSIAATCNAGRCVLETAAGDAGSESGAPSDAAGID